MLSFFRHFSQIFEEGRPAVRRKLTKLFRALLEVSLMFAGFPVVVIIRLIRPVVVVRFMEVDFGRLGGPYLADFYLREKAAGHHRSGCIDLFYFDTSTSHYNKQWLRMWLRVLPRVPFPRIIRAIDHLNRKFSGYEAHLIPGSVFPTMDEHTAFVTGQVPDVMAEYNRRLKRILRSEHSNFGFTASEEERGVKGLQALGVPKNHPFICFHARDSVYLDAVLSKDWRYHDFRDSSIQNYVMAAEAMAERGYYAVRTGAKVKESIETSNPMVVDYATNGSRSDFLDIYLGGKCRFYICSATGMSVPSEVFRKPIVFVNWTVLRFAPVYVSNGLIALKKFYLEEEERCMSFSEILNLDFGGGDTPQIFAKLNLKLIENTPEEILAVSVEMDERLKGTWETSEEDEVLQSRFWALFGPEKVRSPDLRIGAGFLKDNQELLN
jgi:putative glycosyltransferase (TIGR04372 family)